MATLPDPLAAGFASLIETARVDEAVRAPGQRLPELDAFSTTPRELRDDYESRYPRSSGREECKRAARSAGA